MKTAVEWLLYKLEIFATEEEMNIIEQAKEMEKEQIKDACDACFECGIKSNMNIKPEFDSAEDYYNKTFK